MYRLSKETKRGDEYYMIIRISRRMYLKELKNNFYKYELFYASNLYHILEMSNRQIIKMFIQNKKIKELAKINILKDWLWEKQKDMGDYGKELPELKDVKIVAIA